MAFAPQKYELIHFTTSKKRHNLKAGIQFGHNEIQPSQSIRILGVWLDPKLKWHAHAKIAQQKGLAALGAFKRISSSTWGASFTRARLLFNSTIRPAITYGAAAWHSPESQKHNPVIQAISKIQTRGLRMIAGAYRATPTCELESETFTPPIDIFCNKIRARHLRRTYDSTPRHHITGQCQAIRSRLRRRKRRQPTSEARDFRQDKLKWTTQREQEFGFDSSKAILAEWRPRWQEEGKKKKSWWCSIAAQDQPCKNTLIRSGKGKVVHRRKKAREP